MRWFNNDDYSGQKMPKLDVPHNFHTVHSLGGNLGSVVRMIYIWILHILVNIVYVIESAVYRVIFTSCLCENPNE